MSRYSIHPLRDRARSRILACIEKKHMSAQELADAIFMSRDGVNRHLKKMRNEGLIHIAAYSFNRKGGQPAPRYLAGEGQDAVYENTRTPNRHFIVTNRLLAVEQAIRYHHTTGEIAEKLGLTNTRARYYVAILRKTRPIYICGWRQLSAGIAPIYALGSKPDAAKPIRTRAMAYAEKIKRWSADPVLSEKLELQRKVRSVRNRVESTRKKPQSIFSALGL